MQHQISQIQVIPLLVSLLFDTYYSIINFQNHQPVYSIPCGTFDEKYSGQTIQNLKAKKSNCRLLKRSYALSDNVVNHDHCINYEETKIIHQENH